VNRRASVSLVPLLALAMAISGCAQLPFGGGRSTELGATESFELLGRVYVRFGPRAFSGSLRWRHALEADEVWLGGPLGQTAAHIVRDSAGAALTTADQQTYRSMSLDALTRDGLGWTLPLADLSFYVQGKVPQEAAADAERDSELRVLRVARNGWEVQWIEREPVAGATRLPRIELRKDEVEIRLVVDRLDLDAQ
jgi:outer membrane lipoprotein LolB